MGWPQITMIVLSTMSLSVNMAKDGEARPPYSFGQAFIGSVVTYGLLYAGGFFG